jgi:hypothetical protein
MLKICGLLLRRQFVLKFSKLSGILSVSLFPHAGELTFSLWSLSVCWDLKEYFRATYRRAKLPVEKPLALA